MDEQEYLIQKLSGKLRKTVQRNGVFYNPDYAHYAMDGDEIQRSTRDETYDEWRFRQED